MATLIALIGPTASGKTRLATQLAYALQGEIISADSRQVYRGMDIGTGKDLDEYHVEGHAIPYHLINIVDAGTKYNLFEYQKDFAATYTQICARNRQPILCGGTGLYIDAVTKGYQLAQVPYNDSLRAQLEPLPMSALTEKLSSYGPLHNKTDVEDHKRLIRAIEIAEYQRQHPVERLEMPQFETLFLGVEIDRNNRRARITERLKTRLKSGLIEEVRQLLAQGVAAEDLVYYGLEYKFVTQHVLGQLSYNEMFDGLNAAIHQFAKRQMTWFRKMEREGTRIHWLNYHWDEHTRLQRAMDIIATSLR